MIQARNPSSRTFRCNDASVRSPVGGSRRKPGGRRAEFKRLFCPFVDLRIPIHAEPRLPGRLDRPGTAEPVDSFEAADGRDVILCGGEPTLREDLPDLVRRVRRAGAAHITLETDGVALATARASDNL